MTKRTKTAPVNLADLTGATSLNTTNATSRNTTNATSRSITALRPADVAPTLAAAKKAAAKPRKKAPR